MCGWPIKHLVVGVLSVWPADWKGALHVVYRDFYAPYTSDVALPLNTLYEYTV